MSSTKPASPEIPLIGGLLRLCRQELLNAIDREIAAAGMGDVRPAQYVVTQQLAVRSEGLRVTELSSYAAITKASMSALVDGLAANGYVERVADPSDQRAQLVRFTPRGWQFAKVARRAVTRVERAWAKRVGARELEAMRCTLRAIVDSRPDLVRHEKS